MSVITYSYIFPHEKAVYIGQTSRTLKKIDKEHKSDEKSPLQEYFSKHLHIKPSEVEKYSWKYL